ncbi:complement factor H-like isoform X1 [Silurus meridionalis]|uniref:complement factor H-like isoform X1 n=1 Tax=Silurus meridionalis TaxID=175797 RepID=UPI001EEB678D|nr:complement factor H-like isoform X1 [Silurus meridionalis]
MEPSLVVLYLFFWASVYTSAYDVGENLRCRDPKRVINNAILRRINLKAYYQEGGAVQYKCKEGYYLENGPLATCTGGKWNYPQCIPLVETLRCPNPEQEINNAIIKRIHPKAYYLEGATVQYKCKAGYNFENGPQATCFRGKWDYPQCIMFVENVKCPKPERQINNAFLYRAYQRAYYLEGATVQYKCKAGYNFENGPQATCFRGKWDYPQCIPLAQNPKCPDPERQINNGILKKGNLKAYYQEGSTILYKCKEGFYFENGPEATCSAGQWIYPRCLQ